MLLVDDEPQGLAALAELLRLESASVTVLDNARQALEAAQAHAFDVVITDIAMPQEDGYWLLARLRESERIRSVPVIAVSGMARPADRQRALEAGFDAHVSKPLTLDQLAIEIERVKPHEGLAPN
jgi:two-component system CheB/CheR fusion protein